MSKEQLQKNLVLSTEFDRYVVRHPEVFDGIPSKPHIFITVKGDEAFNRANLAMAEKAKDERCVLVEARKEGRKWKLKLIPRN